MSGPSSFTHRWSSAPPPADAMAVPMGLLGSRKGRIGSPSAVRLSRVRDVAWAMCAPPGAPTSLLAWNPLTSDSLWGVELAHDSVFDVSPDGAALFCTAPSGHCALLDARSGVEFASLRDTPGAPDAVILSDGPVRLALIARAGRVRLWRLDVGALVLDLAGGAPVALSPDGALLAYCDPARAAVTVTGVVEGTSVRVRAERGGRITAIDLGIPDVVLLGHDDGRTSERSLGLGRKTVHVAPTRSPVSSLRSHGSRVASGHADGLVVVRERGSDALPDLLWGDGEVGALAPTLDAALHRDAQAAVLVELSTRSRHDHRSGHLDAVTSIALSSDGRIALTASRDGTLRLWRPQTGEALDVMEGHLGAVRSVVMSPDGRVAWSSGEHDGLRIWDLNSATELACRAEHPRDLSELSIDPSGQRLLALSLSARRALLLDAEGAMVAQFPTELAPAASLGFVERGAFALVASSRRDDGLALHRVDARTGSPVDPIVLTPGERSLSRARPCWLHRVTASGDAVVGDTMRATLTRCDLTRGDVYLRLPTGAQLLGHPLLAIGRSVVIASSGGGRVEVCALHSGVVSSQRLLRRGEAVTALALSPDESYFLVGTSQGLVLRCALRLGETSGPLS